MESTQIAVLSITTQEWNETKEMIRTLCDKVGELTAKEQKELLSPKEVCEILKCGRTTFQRYVVNGVFEIIRPNTKKSSKIYVRRSELERLIEDGKI